jgi:hypothetical protein
MTIQIGRKLNPPSGYSLLLDASIPESYAGSSAWIDLSSRSNNASLANSPTFSRNSFGAGQLSFNGVNQYGSLSELGLGGNFTISTWVKKSDTVTTGWIVGGGWVATDGGSGGGTGVALGVKGSTLSLTTWGGVSADVEGGSVQSGVWYHLCAVQNASSSVAKIFLNGERVASGSFYNAHYYTTGGAVTSYIGRNSHSSIDEYYHFSGSIGQVLIYNTMSLSDEQVLEIFGQTRGRFGI